MNTVPSISPHNTETLGLDNLLDLVTDFSVRNAGFAEGDSLIHSFLGGVHQVLRFLVDLANRVSGVKITMKTSVVYLQVSHVPTTIFPVRRTQSHIKIDDISLLQRPLIGNTMANDFVDTCTYALGELDVVERTGVGVSVNTGLMANCIELIGGDTGFDVGGDEVQDFPSKLRLRVRDCLQG